MAASASICIAYGNRVACQMHVCMQAQDRTACRSSAVALTATDHTLSRRVTCIVYTHETSD